MLSHSVHGIPFLTEWRQMLVPYSRWPLRQRQGQMLQMLQMCITMLSEAPVRGPYKLSSLRRRRICIPRYTCPGGVWLCVRVYASGWSDMYGIKEKEFFDCILFLSPRAER